MRELKIGTSWVRGVVGDALTPELVVNFARAFGTWAGGSRVVIGRDTRRSSVAMRSAALSGLLASGCEVIDLGLAPTPLTSFAIRELAAQGGMSITGSHNDARWNALKFLGPDGSLLNTVKSEELLDIYHSTSFRNAGWQDIKPVAENQSVAERYLEHLLSVLDGDLIRTRGFRVAVDFCNGTCGALTAKFLQSLGCTLLPVNEEPSGEFAHAPSPNRANMRQLSTLMKCFQADLGAAINVDGDRIGFVTADGTALSEEYALPLAAGIRMSRRPGTIATGFSTSRMIDVVAERYSQQVIRTPVGESFVIDQGIAEGAVLAGEGCGGVAALPASLTFDGLLTLGLVLEQMAEQELSLAQLAGQLPSFVMRKREIPCPPNQVYRMLDRFRDEYSTLDPDCTDGVFVKWKEDWLHVRASNTEPLLRIISEANSEDRADELMEQAQTFMRRMAFEFRGR